MKTRSSRRLPYETMGSRRGGCSANNRMPRNLRFDNYDDEDDDDVFCLGDSNDMARQIPDTESSEDHEIKCLWEKPSAVLEQDSLNHFPKTSGDSDHAMRSSESIWEISTDEFRRTTASHDRKKIEKESSTEPKLRKRKLNRTLDSDSFDTNSISVDEIRNEKASQSKKETEKERLTKPKLRKRKKLQTTDNDSVDTSYDDIIIKKPIHVFKSHGSESIGIGSRTRSKRGNSLDVNSFSSDSAFSESSYSSESEYDADDEIFVPDNSECSDSMDLSGSYVEESPEKDCRSKEVCNGKDGGHSLKKRSNMKHPSVRVDVEDQSLEEVYGRKSKKLSKEAHSVPKHFSKRMEFSDSNDDEESVGHKECENVELSGMKSPSSLDASSKVNDQTDQIEAQPDVRKNTEENAGNDLDVPERLTERAQREREDLLNSHTKHRFPNKGCNEEVNGLQSEDHSGTNSKRVKKVVLSRNKCSEEDGTRMRKEILNNATGTKVHLEGTKAVCVRKEHGRVKGDKRYENKNADVEDDQTVMNQITDVGLKTFKPDSSSFVKKNELNDCINCDLGNDVEENKDIGDVEAVNEFEKCEQPTVFDCVHPRKSARFFESLRDAVLDKATGIREDESHEETEKFSEPKSSLRKKFRFEDEMPKLVEKSEYEIMMEGLFEEMNCCLEYGNVDPQSDQGVEEETGKSCDQGKFPAYLCSKGKHYLIEDDEIGVYCQYCRHLEREAKHMMPQWAEKPFRSVGRKRFSSREKSSAVDGLDFTPGESSKGLSNEVKGTVWDIIKPSIRETMFPHQQEGFEFCWKSLAGTIRLDQSKTSDVGNIGGCIISHAPGTGKTLLTIGFIQTYLKLFPDCRPLVIAPAAVLNNWEAEFRKWEIEFPFYNTNDPDISWKDNKMALRHFPRIKCSNSDEAHILKIFLWDRQPSILGMSYSLFGRLAGNNNVKKHKVDKARKKAFARMEPDPSLRKILLEKPGLVVLDEGHTPRNKRSNIWNSLLELRTGNRVILSGTPFQNNFEELFNVFRIVRPLVAELFAKEKRFSEMNTFRRMHEKAKYVDAETSQSQSINKAIEELKTAISPFVHVHKGTVLQSSLPGLRNSVVLLNPPELQKSLIEKIDASQNTFEFEAKVAFISTHPCLFQSCKPTEKEMSGLDKDKLEASRADPSEGAKIRFIMELVRNCAARKEKVLIFSQYIPPLELVKEYLEKAFDLGEGKQILVIKGRINQKQRHSLITDFNSRKSDAMVLLATIKCCSEGINLIGASRVVLLDVVWNPSVER